MCLKGISLHSKPAGGYEKFKESATVLVDG